MTENEIKELFKKFIRDEVHGGDFDQGNSLKDTMSVFERWWNKNKSLIKSNEKSI